MDTIHYGKTKKVIMRVEHFFRNRQRFTEDQVRQHTSSEDHRLVYMSV